MRSRGFIKYVIAIIAVLTVFFLSQEPYFRGIGRNIYNQAEAQARFLASKASKWAADNIYPRVASEVEKRGEEVKGEVNRQKDNLMKNIWENIKKYFANIFEKSTGTQVE